LACFFAVLAYVLDLIRIQESEVAYRHPATISTTLFPVFYNSGQINVPHRTAPSRADLLSFAVYEHGSAACPV
jgi:hypothetical protein